MKNIVKIAGLAGTLALSGLGLMGCVGEERYPYARLIDLDLEREKTLNEQKSRELPKYIFEINRNQGTLKEIDYSSQR